MYLKKKGDGRIKGRGCADGRKQRSYIDKSEAASPTVSVEAVFITSTIDACEDRDVGVADIPGAYLHTDLDENTLLRFEGAMAELLTKINTKMIKKNTGGLLLIDYGYNEKKMKNTLQAISNHKFANILDNIGNVDITHNINFNLFERFTKKIGGLETNLTTQKEFLLKMGINERAEIISKNQSFLKKTDIYFRLKRLVDEKHMGNLFKFMLIKNRNNKFRLGFEN